MWIQVTRGACAGLLAGFGTALAFGQSIDFLLGSPAAVSPLNRTIVIDATTRWVNVRDDEVVNFSIVGDGQFAWKFDGPGWRSFDLRQVAPSGTLTQPITVYITRGLQW